MAILSITHADLLPFASDLSEAKANAMIDDTLARAKRLAPCLAGEVTDDVAAAARAILRRIILRWHDSGSGAIQQTSFTTGPYTEQQTIDTRTREKAMFWPTEIKELQDLCREVTHEKGQAFSINMGASGSRLGYVTVDGVLVDLDTRPDLWLEYL